MKLKREDITVLIGLAVAVIVLPMVVGLSLGWPTPVWAAVIGLGLLGVAQVGRQTSFRRKQDELRASYEQPPSPPPPPQPAQPRENQEYVPGVTLPSAEPEYRFLFSGTVCWTPAPNPVGMRHTNPSALAVESILSRAARLTGPEAPVDHALVGHRLAASLGTALPDQSGQVVAWATGVVLAVPDEDLQRLHKLAELRKQEQVWEHERGFERGVRAYLSREVLDSPGNAVVWWLARHIDDVEETARLIGPLAQLTAAANNRPIPEVFGPPAPDLPGPRHANGTAGRVAISGVERRSVDPAIGLADQVFPEQGSAEQGSTEKGRAEGRQRFGQELAQLVERHGGADLAGHIRAAFDPETPS